MKIRMQQHKNVKNIIYIVNSRGSKKIIITEKQKLDTKNLLFILEEVERIRLVTSMESKLKFSAFPT